MKPGGTKGRGAVALLAWQGMVREAPPAATASRSASRLGGTRCLTESSRVTLPNATGRISSRSERPPVTRQVDELHPNWGGTECPSLDTRADGDPVLRSVASARSRTRGPRVRPVHLDYIWEWERAILDRAEPSVLP